MKSLSQPIQTNTRVRANELAQRISSANSKRKQTVQYSTGKHLKQLTSTSAKFIAEINSKEFANRILNSNAKRKLSMANANGLIFHFHSISDCLMYTESRIIVPKVPTYLWDEFAVALANDPTIFDNKLQIESTEFVEKAGMTMKRVKAYTFPLNNVDPYHAETALFLDMHPARIALDPSSVSTHLATFGVDAQALALYQDLGMSAQDAAQSIRMKLQLAEESQGDTQASTDFLAGMDGYEFTTDGGFSL